MATQTRKKSGFIERLRPRLAAPRPVAPPSDEPPGRPVVAMVVCVLISCLLWFTLTMRETYVRVVEMPTEVINLPADQALVDLPPRHVRVEVQGPGWQLFGLFGMFSIASESWTIPIDASQSQANLEATLQGQTLQKNVLIRNVTPARIDLEREQRIMRRVPVRLIAEINTPPTHDLAGPPVVDPDTVAVAGARSVVSGIRFWPTERYEKNDLRDSIAVELALADTLGGLVTHSPQKVLLRAQALVFTESTREIDVTVRGIPSGREVVRLEPSSVRVRYRVPLSQYDQVQRAMDFYAEVSYEDILTDTTGRIRPELHLPPDLEIRDVEMFPPTLRAYQVVSQ